MSRLIERVNLPAGRVRAIADRLTREGLVVSNGTLSLSPEGQRHAIEMVRAHRLWETYLADRMALDSETVHTEAERLEHAASDELVERMASVMGHPEMDPHGSPIPTAEGEVAERLYPPLSEMPAGAIVIVREVSDADEGRLRYLAELGLYPGTRVEVLDREPFEGPILVRIDGQERSLGHGLGEMVRVERQTVQQGGGDTSTTDN